MKILRSEVSIETDFPWIVFRLSENQCVINSQRVISITALTDSVTTMPDAPLYVRGLLTLRGRTIPLIDLLILFGKRMLWEEYQEFADKLEAQKQDHLRWAKELTNPSERTEQLQRILDEVEQQVISEIVGLLVETAATLKGGIRAGFSSG